MSKKDRKIKYSIEAADSTYQTGSTQPPKSHLSVILLLLGVIIFLGGVVTALGFTNFRLFQELAEQDTSESAVVCFSHEDSPVAAANAQQTGLGFCGVPVSDFWHTYHQLPLGIFIQSVNNGSEADRKGILPGDILTQVNNTPVTTFDELSAALPEDNSPIQVILYRENTQIKLTLQPEK